MFLLTYVFITQQAYETAQNELRQNKVLLSINLIKDCTSHKGVTESLPTKFVTEKQPVTTETSTKVEIATTKKLDTTIMKTTTINEPHATTKSKTTTSAKSTQTTKTSSTLQGTNSFTHEL